MPRPTKDALRVIVYEHKRGVGSYVCCFTTHTMTQAEVLSALRKALKLEGR